MGLANHRLVKEASIRAIEKYGLNFSASRQTTGTSVIHLELEKQLSLFKDKEDTVIFASGYMTNKIMMQVLRKEYSAVFIDKSAHASIKDGLPTDISRVYYYDHCNTCHLETLLKRTTRYRPLIISDGLFALTGEITPLSDIMALADRFNALVIVDDAHATGIL
ncbi:MAG TPA: 8-amino-7-oxononanoate synthase, partial [Bacteroidales bacterium]|nr:8-amino-7-oxononanoate synthase [Bacteroidales bacterium]